jgi:hypothetical protein
MKPHIAKLVEEAKRKHALRLQELESMRQAVDPTGEHLATFKQQHGIPAKPEGSTLNSPGIRVHVTPATERKITPTILTGTTGYKPTIPGLSLNEQQNQAVELAMRGKSFNLIGAAGTGKTTTTREVIGQLVRLPHISPIREATKWLSKDSPGIVVISFTNKAVNNLKKFLPDELKKHCLTYHKLLEFAPVQYDLEPGNPASKKTMRFEPSFGVDGPLPHISCIIVEESSMVEGDANDRGESLHSTLLKALPNPSETQFIFLGDLNQLPPIFGSSVLGFKLLDLPTVELTHVYRQALESPIITLAHKVREGRGFSQNGKGVLEITGFCDDRGEHGKVTIKPWQKKVESGPACKILLQKFLIPLVLGNDYDFDNTAILCPFNKSFGTIELNRGIADALAKKRDAEVYEVIARYQKSYWAVGDRVLVDRREAIITKIEPTPGYSGPIPEQSSKTLNRWGQDSGSQARPEDELKPLDEDELLASLSVQGEEGEGTKNAASHTITVEFIEDGTSLVLSNAGTINAMLFSYVLTVHKSQGSEWKRVFILLHYSHNTMLSRELLYTAITRAKHELFIICEPDRKEIYNSITRAAKSPEIQGVTLKEKASYFSAKRKSMTKLADKLVLEGMK